MVANVWRICDDRREGFIRRSQDEIAYHDPLEIARRQAIAFRLPERVSIQLGPEEIYPAAFFSGHLFRSNKEGAGPDRRIENAFGPVRETISDHRLGHPSRRPKLPFLA